MTSDPGSIKAIDGSSVHKITSGQVVVDLQTAVKEMVENSLDAGATTIGELELPQKLYLSPNSVPKRYGFVTTVSNLSRLSTMAPGFRRTIMMPSVSAPDRRSHEFAQRDFPLVGVKHCTSKLSSFEDLTTVSTFGFRGEAISSLCALSESVTVTTAMVSDAPMGTVIELDRSGKVTSRSTKVARQVGILVRSQRERSLIPAERDHSDRHGAFQTTPRSSKRA